MPRRPPRPALIAAYNPPKIAKTIKTNPITDSM